MTAPSRSAANETMKALLSARSPEQAEITDALTTLVVTNLAYGGGLFNNKTVRILIGTYSDDPVSGIQAKPAVEPV
jgi:hypothetical protein